MRLFTSRFHTLLIGLKAFLKSSAHLILFNQTDAKCFIAHQSFSSLLFIFSQYPEQVFQLCVKRKLLISQTLRLQGRLLQTLLLMG